MKYRYVLNTVVLKQQYDMKIIIHSLFLCLLSFLNSYLQITYGVLPFFFTLVLNALN